MNVLITGASGYIGKKIIRRLSANGHKIYAVVKSDSNIDNVKQYIEKAFYTEDYDKLSEQIQSVKPHCYINVAGRYYGSHSVELIREMFESNILFPTVVLDAAVKAGCKNVIHTSSFQQCYQGESYNPVNLYAASKQSFEDILKFYVESEHVKAIILQLFDTYGEDDNRNKIFNRIRKLKAEEYLDLTSGMQKMYFCYIDDVIEAYIVAMNQLINSKKVIFEKYSVRGDKPIELKTFIDNYCLLMKRKYNLNWGKRPYMDREIMDPSEYGTVLPNWNAKVTYKQGISLCVEYDRKNRKGELCE